jgi:hypothetical protein
MEVRVCHQVPTRAPTPAPTKPEGICNTFPAPPAHTIFNSSEYPASVNNFDGDDTTLVLSTRFRMEKQATITAFRFFKAANEGDHHVGNLYSVDGELLATTGQFSTKNCNGPRWVEVPFLRPFRPTAGQEYNVVIDNVKYYPKTENYPFGDKQGNGIVPTGGYFSTEPGTLPVFGPGTTNYWIDGE